MELGNQILLEFHATLRACHGMEKSHEFRLVLSLQLIKYTLQRVKKNYLSYLIEVESEDGSFVLWQ